MAEYNKAEADFFLVALKEEARTILWKVHANVDPETVIKSVINDLQALAPREEGETRTDEEIWSAIREKLLEAAYATRPQCVRCGDCCTTGSPTLMHEDIELFRKDILKPSEIITIRKGEPVYSSIEERPGTAEREMLKVRETPGEKTCTFYRKQDQSCSIYESRPQQCRKQECWNPQLISAVDNNSKMDRSALLAAIPGLWEIIERHEEKCSHEEFARAMTRLAATKGQTVDSVLDLLQYDMHVREFVSERFGLAEDTMKFFFGRPLIDFLGLYGLKLEQREDGYFLTPAD
jgi:Fe-S-cluster containining protein